jgi:hypothetical protein
MKMPRERGAAVSEQPSQQGDREKEPKMNGVELFYSVPNALRHRAPPPLRKRSAVYEPREACPEKHKSFGGTDEAERFLEQPR